MKLHGETFTGPNEAIVVIPRNGKDILFKARAVLDYARFEALCPRPEPKKVKLASGEMKVLWDDTNYAAAFDRWGTLKTSYIIIESLKATPGLEWEGIQDDNPETWNDYKKELDAAFFTDREIQKIVGAVWEANGIDESKLEEARKRFLASQAEEPKT